MARNLLNAWKGKGMPARPRLGGGLSHHLPDHFQEGSAMRSMVRGWGLAVGVAVLLGGAFPAAAVSTSSNIPVTGNF